MNTPHVEQAAQRALAAWHGLRLLPVEVDAVEARVGGHGVSGPEHELRWVLPAFMAGLRRISPRPEVGEMELRNLADALARIDPNVESIENFREWIWSGAATGFELELQSSFMEALDDAAMEREVEANSVIDEMRASALRSLSTRVELLSTRTLGRLADRDELDLPLSSPETHANGPDTLLSHDRAEALRLSCEDPAGWILAEVRLVTAQSALADTVRVDRFAARFQAAFKSAPQLCLGAVESLAQRARREDPFAQEMLRCLDGPAFAADLGSALWQNPGSARRELEIVLAMGPQSSMAALGRLLERAGEEPAWVETFCGLVEAAGGRLDAGLLHRAEVPVSGELSALLAAYGARGRAILWDRALRGGEAWLGRSFAILCRAWLEAGEGENILVPIARDRGVAPALRLEVLDVLCASPALLEKAIAWRMGELLEAPAVRERLKLLRSNP